MSACYSLKASILLAIVRKANCMMKNMVSVIVIGIRAPNYAYDRQILAVSPYNAVDNREAPNSEGHNTGSHASRVGIAISSIDDIELIVASHQIELRLCNEKTS